MSQIRTVHPRVLPALRTAPGRALALAALAAALAGGACRQDPGEGPVDPDAGPPADAGYPPPRTDLVPAVGSDAAVDIATWNIENFPASAGTPALVADLVASLDLDLVAVQEIASISAFNELIDRLPGYRGILSSHTYGDGSYQKVGFLYRTDVLEATFDTLLFTGDGFEFPRPALRADFRVVGADLDFAAVTVHLKAGGGADDVSRRTAAILALEAYVRGSVDGPGDDDVIVLGDFNDRVIGAQGEDVMGPWLDAPALYTVHTVQAAEEGLYSFIPNGAILDHVVTTAALADELAGGSAVIPGLDAQLFGYEGGVSDHLPVVVSMPALPAP